MTMPLFPSQIVWVTILDPHGTNPKLRPAVIHSITDDGMATVIAITSLTGGAPAETSVAIPWQRNGHPRTKLKKSSVAVCTWIDRVPMAAIQPTAGRVPMAAMQGINDIVHRLFSQDP